MYVDVKLMDGKTIQHFDAESVFWDHLTVTVSGKRDNLPYIACYNREAVMYTHEHIEANDDKQL